MSRIIVYQLDSNGLPAKRTADFAIGAPSLYGRKKSPALATRSEGSRFSGFAYDNVHHRLFVRDGSVNAWSPAGRMLVFDVHPDRMQNGPEAIAVFGQPDFTSRLLGGVGPNQMASIDGSVLDEKNQRLIVTDGRNNRVLIWDIDPSRLVEAPIPVAVLGQTNLNTRTAGAGPDRLDRPNAVYYDNDNDRLFVSDVGNNRVLVFDARPGQLQTGMNATVVIGQPDFDSIDRGIGPGQFSSPQHVLHDPANQRLLVSDDDNERILVFDVAPERLESGVEASYVLGQRDFFSSESRSDPKKAVIGDMQLDSVRQRLYINESSDRSRALVFDVHPERIRNDPDAVAVMFQESFDNIERQVSRTQETYPRPYLDEDQGLLYVAGGYPGGNRVSIFDVAGQVEESGMPSLDTLGHYDDEGNVDFEERTANGRINGRVIYPRAVSLDSVDHRLFVNDQYNGRILVFQLDRENRVLNRTASVILGQPDAFTGKLQEPSARTMKMPLALAYDEVSKRLFVGDSWHERILVFDARPERLKTFDEAIFVLGQPDFETITPGLGVDKIDFGVGSGRGITSTQPTPLAMTVDPEERRLFVTDGGNHRVLVFDISEGELRTGAAAIAVIGQSSFEENRPTPRESVPRISLGNFVQGEVGKGRVTDARGFDTPSGLAHDPNHNRLFVVDGNNSRVLIFNVTPGQLENGPDAFAVLGQQDFTTGNEIRLDLEEVNDDTGRRSMRMPNGVAYDTVNDRLYVVDKGNDRVLMFEVAPDRLQSGMAAIGVIGQKDFVTRIPGNGEQEQLLDPREIAFDSEHQRLYTTDSFWARLMIFDLPRTERTVELAPQGMMSYGTLDAWNGRNMPDLNQQESWGARLTTEGDTPGSFLVYTKTRQEIDPLSERRSRVLISETSVVAPEATRDALFYTDEREGKSHAIVVSNPTANVAEIRFRFQEATEIREVSRAVNAGGHLEIQLTTLFGTWVEGKVGTLRIASPEPVASLLLRRTETERGEKLILAIPRVKPLEFGEEAVIAGLTFGGGYESELVLVNPHSEEIQGEISILDQDGQPARVAELPESIPYGVEPGDVVRFRIKSSSLMPETAYVVIRSQTGTELPWTGAVVSLWKDALLQTETIIPVQSRTAMAWIPVDTLPSVIRHGRSPSQMSFAVANSTRTPALLRFTLFDVNGDEQGRYEQILPVDSQREWSLADLFNLQEFRGSVRLWSDVPVAVSAQRITRTLRGENVRSELGYVDITSLEGKRTLELPHLLNGLDVSTEIILINPTEAELEGNLEFLSREGVATAVVLR